MASSLAVGLIAGFLVFPHLVEVGMEFYIGGINDCEELLKHVDLPYAEGKITNKFVMNCVYPLITNSTNSTAGGDI